MSRPVASRASNRELVAWRFGAEAAGRLAAFLLFPLLANHLGTEGVGVQAQIVALTGLLVPLATAGLGVYLVRRVAGRDDRSVIGSRLISALLSVVALSCAIGAVVALAAPWLNDLLFRTPEATSVIRLSALLIVAAAVESILVDQQRARLRIGITAIVQIGQALILVTGTWLILAAGGGLLGVVWVLVLARVVGVVLLLSSVHRSGDLEVTGLVPAHELLHMVRFGAPVVVIGLSGWILSLGDRLVIGYYRGADDVGVYSAAYALAALLGAVGGPFWGPLYPLMAAARNQEQPAAVAAMSRKYGTAFLILGLPAVVGLTVIAADLLHVLGTAEFRVATHVFAFIAVALFIEQLSTPVYYLIFLHDEPWAVRNRTLACGLVNVLLNVALIPFMGIGGAALATLVSYLLLDGLLLSRVRGYGYRLQDVYDLSRGGRVLAATCVMLLVIAWAHRTGAGLPAIAVTVCLGAATYVLALLAGCGFRPQRLLAR